MNICIMFLFWFTLFVRIKRPCVLFNKTLKKLSFALHVNVGRFYFVFFLAFCNILYTFVGIDRIKLKNT